MTDTAAPDPRSLEDISDIKDIFDFGAVCSECADLLGATWPTGHMATFWIATCGHCGRHTGVTGTRDYIWPRFGKKRLNPMKVD